MMDPRVEALLDSATRPYRSAGRFAWHFARAKIRHDPVFLTVVKSRWLPDRGSLLDLGCGRGLLLALLAAAREQFSRGAWPENWPPPVHLDLHGIELCGARVRIAQCALAGLARVTRGDIRQCEFAPSSAIAILDVLLYLNSQEQLAVLRGAAVALKTGGVLLLREADAGAGPAFHLTRHSERALEIMRGRASSQLHYRSAGEWIGLLESLGFSVCAEPMSAGTPFANVLFVCRKRDGR